MKRALAAAVVLALVAAGLPQAAVAKPDPAKRNAKLLGDWWEAMLLLPAEVNPLLGNGDLCLQVKGNFVSPAPPPGAPPITCQLKHGQKLFIEGFTSECSNVEQAPYFGANYAEQVACARLSDATVSAPVFTLDGTVVPNVEVVSPPGKVNLPADNVLTGTRQKATFAAHGWNAIVEKLPRGSHTLHIHQAGVPAPFEPDIDVLVIVR